MESLEQRLRLLEATLAVQELKARYLQACDDKDCQAFRDCFADGIVAIDYGPIGQFERADDLVAIFEQIACHPHMREWHLASNPRITVHSEAHASGRWSLHYQLINSEEGTLTQLGGIYDDEYRLIDGAWKITATAFKPRSQLVLKLDSAAVKTIAFGEAA